MQVYIYGINSIDLLDYRVGGLSVAQKNAIDAEYENWLQNKIRMGSRGPD